MRHALKIAVIAVAAMALASPASAAAPRVSLADLEDEVMCPICGTLLELSQAPQAQRQRALISELIAAGAAKGEIKDRLVAEYGREVLAEPEGSGFQLSAYLVPLLAFVVALLALAIAVGRWRRDSGRRAGPGPTETPRGEDAERLDADLARYDL